MSRATLRIGLLGETTVSADGVPLPTPAPRARAILARLALDVGRPVSVDRLLDDVWGDPLPAGRAKAVAYQIKELRNAIEPDRTGSGSLIVTSPAGYTLALEPASVDIFRFEQLVDDARAAADDSVKCQALAEDALALWRGRPFAGIGASGVIDTEVDRLLRLHLLARRTLLEARLAQGFADVVVPALTALAREHPLDEAVTAALMRSLAATGRTPDALRAYADLRRRLGEELGLEPSGDLAALESSLLSGALTSPSVPDEPRPRHSALPAETTSLVGRATEVPELLELVRDERLVTLAGIGGVGKTRLAQRVATVAADEFPDGAVFVPLAPIDRGDLVIDKIGEALGVRAGEGRSLDEVVATYLATRQVLIVLDNCEHVVAAAATAVDRLLARAPGVVVIATSRESLGVAGEHVYRVATLDVGDDAVNLFVERAAAANPDLVIDGTVLEQVRSICRRVEGLPLAIELAAARTRSMSPKDISDRLAGSLDVLNRGRRTVRPRQQTMHHAIDWSYDLLGSAERSLINRLSVFVGGFDHAAALAVADPALRPSDVDDLLDQLVDKSLVEISTDALGRTRHRMLEPIRQFARARLGAEGDEELVVQRHADHVLAVTTEAEPHFRGPEQVGWQTRVDVLRDDIRAALPALLDTGRLDDYLDVCWNLMWYWFRDGFHRESVEAIEVALDAVEGGAVTDPARVARGCLHAALLAADVTMEAEAVELTDRGRPFAEQLGDPRLLGLLVFIRGRVKADLPGAIGAAADIERGEELIAAGSTVLWNPRYDAAALDLWRGMGRQDDDVETRRGHFERAIAGFRAEGDLSLVCGAQLLSSYLSGFGTEEWIASNLQASIISAERVGSRHQIAHARMFAALHAMRSGIGRPSAESLDDAAEILDSMGDAPCWVSSLGAAAAIRIERDEIDEARANLLSAARHLVRSPSPPRQLMVLCGAAEVVVDETPELAARLVGRVDALTGGAPFGVIAFDTRVARVKAQVSEALGADASAETIARAAGESGDADALEAFVHWAEAAAR